jgi:DNA-binding CsgD family transcriptional regulator
MRERIKRLGTVSEALTAIRDYYGLANVTYHLAQTILGGIDTPFVRTTYPDSWVARYLLNGYVRIDPIAREGFTRSQPFDWSEVQTAEQEASFLVDAAQYGIGSLGYSIPIMDRASRHALMSLTSAQSKAKWAKLKERARDDWIALGSSVHRIAVRELYGPRDPVPRLSPREVECLNWLALGKDHKDIAAILGISEHTARDYTKSARIKLDCATLSAAAARASHLRIITPWDKRVFEHG